MSSSDDQDPPRAADTINESTSHLIQDQQTGPDHESAAVRPTSSPAAPIPASNPPRAVLLGATALLSSFFLYQAPSIWDEWKGLKKDWELTRQTQVIGFIGISPNLSFARPPGPWIVERDDSVLLWSGWRNGIGHSWFRIGRGEIELDLLGPPMGRDVVRAIDQTIVENRGDEHWELMQSDTRVVGFARGGEAMAYPMLLLGKVEVINDTLGGEPLLVVSTPFLAPEETVDYYDPNVEGRRLHFGLSGYFVHPVERHPLLYDRETESLWMVQPDHQIRCVAGTLRGTQLRHLGRGEPRDWSDWLYENPRTRLVVGADRSRNAPIPQITGFPNE